MIDVFFTAVETYIIIAWFIQSMLHFLIKKSLLFFSTGTRNYLNILNGPAHEYISEYIHRNNLTYIRPFTKFKLYCTFLKIDHQILVDTYFNCFAFVFKENSSLPTNTGRFKASIQKPQDCHYFYYFNLSFFNSALSNGQLIPNRKALQLSEETLTITDYLKF